MSCPDGAVTAENVARALACGDPGCRCPRREGKEWKTHCPVPCHVDRVPSLSVADRDGHLLVHCHAACGQETVIEALREQKLWPEARARAARRPDDGSRRRARDSDPWTNWADRGLPPDFVRSEGVSWVPARACFVFPFGDLPVRKMRPLDGAAKYFWDPPEGLRPPFWPLPPSEGLPPTILITAGESDCLAARYAGLTAFAVTKGENAPPSPESFAALKDAGTSEVVVIYDADAGGKQGAPKTAQAARAAGLRAKVGRLPAKLAAAGGKDICDLFALLRHDPAALRQALGEMADESSESDPSIPGGSEETGLRIIPSTEIPPPSREGAEGLLGPFLPQPPGVVLLAGETSAGKTVLSYNMARSIAEGRELAGLIPERPLRVLYVDLESPEDVYRGLVETIGRSPGLAFVRALPHVLSTPEGREDLREVIRTWGAKVVIIDPLSVAWPVRDENDNAEADRQMWGLKEIAVATSTLIVALWNMGEGQVKEKFRARGATARMDRVDVGLNYTEVSETVRQLKIIKSRYGTLGLGLTLRFAGEMGLEAVGVEEGLTPSRLARVQARIKELLAERSPQRRKELVEVLGREGLSEDLVDKALHRLVMAGEVVHEERGVYSLPVSSEPPNIHPSESRKLGAHGQDEPSRAHQTPTEVKEPRRRAECQDTHVAVCACCGGPTAEGRQPCLCCPEPEEAFTASADISEAPARNAVSLTTQPALGMGDSEDAE